MSITQSDVVPKAYFVTGGSQLRRINAVETNEKGELIVWYSSKSANPPRPSHKKEKFDQAASIKNAAQMQTFIDDCAGGHKLTEEEIRTYRIKGIILEGE